MANKMNIHGDWKLNFSLFSTVSLKQISPSNLNKLAVLLISLRINSLVWSFLQLCDVCFKVRTDAMNVELNWVSWCWLSEGIQIKAQSVCSLHFLPDILIMTFLNMFHFCNWLMCSLTSLHGLQTHTTLSPGSQPNWVFSFFFCPLQHRCHSFKHTLFAIDLQENMTNEMVFSRDFQDHLPPELVGLLNSELLNSVAKVYVPTWLR